MKWLLLESTGGKVGGLGKMLFLVFGGGRYPVLVISTSSISVPSLYGSSYLCFILICLCLIIYHDWQASICIKPFLGSLSLFFFILCLWWWNCMVCNTTLKSLRNVISILNLKNRVTCDTLLCLLRNVLILGLWWFLKFIMGLMCLFWLIFVLGWGFLESLK